jgi:hypothetical protein
VVRTPVGSIGPDSWLCQAFREVVKVQVPVRERELDQPGHDHDGTADPDGREIVIRRRVKMVDKLRAIDLDSKLAGHFSKPEPPPAEPGAAPVTVNLEAIRQAAQRLAKENGASLLWLQ